MKLTYKWVVLRPASLWPVNVFWMYVNCGLNMCTLRKLRNLWAQVYLLVAFICDLVISDSHPASNLVHPALLTWASKTNFVHPIHLRRWILQGFKFIPHAFLWILNHYIITTVTYQHLIRKVLKSSSLIVNFTSCLSVLMAAYDLLTALPAASVTGKWTLLTNLMK